MSERFDAIIFGAGFGGSIMSMALRRLGFSVLLVEKGRHPRFAIGESSTPFANLLLETISTEFNLPNLRPLCEWGLWQKTFPNLPCGLKRGFSFFHSRALQGDDNACEKRLLVAASPNDNVADTHWYRPAFDEHLVREATDLGVVYRDHTDARVLDAETGRVQLRGPRGTGEVQVRMMIDAAARASVLARDLPIPDAPFERFPRTSAIYAHFRDVERSLDSDWLRPGETPPYPPDDAAVHHVFVGGWAWVLRFNNGITSAGAALEISKRGTLNSDPEIAWKELIQGIPPLGKTFAHAAPVTPFYTIASLPFRRGSAAGSNWALLPGAAGFVDPLLSTGFALNLLGILRIARALREGNWRPSEYEEHTLSELDITAQLVGALYAKMASPSEFNRLTFLYFAALSYTETAWRLGKPDLASTFLLANHAKFSRDLQSICRAALAGQAISREAIERIISPFDIAGLTRWERANLYNVSLDDLCSSAHKLGIAPEDDRLKNIFGNPAALAHR